MPLPPSLRERIPFALRIALRRAPALLRDAVRSLWGEPLHRASPEGFPFVQTQRRSPMRRQGTRYQDELQQAKEHNVSRTTERLDGLMLPAGGEFSWHRAVGPPLRANGFVPGPELHDGELAMGGGGGACQSANLVFYLAATGGMEILERHRHGWDLFPDDARTLPFGLGATVFYPHRDLRFRNPHAYPVRLSLRVEDGFLVGALTQAQDTGARWEVQEQDHRFVRRPDGIWRENTLLRVRDNGTSEVLVRNRARVTYALPDQVGL